VVSPGSRCPQCGYDIRWYDNLPVLSWLILHGRCRNCQTPISIRYPIVELLIGLIFMTLAVEAFHPRGPWWLLNVDARMFLAIDWPKLALAYVMYVLLASTLVCAAYIAWDGQHVPWRLYLPAIIAGAIVPLYWNEVRPLGVSSNDIWQTALAGVKEGTVGAALGFIFGLALDTLRDFRNLQGEPRGRVRIALATIGWVLGARCVMILMPVACAVAMVWFFVSGRSWRSACSAPLVGVALAATLLILGGRVVFEDWPLWNWPDRYFSISASVATLIAATLLRWLTPPQEPELPSPSPDTQAANSPDVMYP
jgi:leader peptidase (prepilin peptidase)/N-methyltransferase